MLVLVRAVVGVLALMIYVRAYAVCGCGAVAFRLVRPSINSWRCGVSYVLGAVVGTVPGGLLRLLHDTHAHSGSSWCVGVSG